MKRLLFLVLASFLVLAACGNKEDNKSDDNKKSESKSEKSNDNKKSKDKKSNNDNKQAKNNDSDNLKDNNKQSSKEANNNQQDNNQNASTEDSKQQININNITDRKTLESVIYGNYTEEQKIQAYNNAVANNVIPQGNVMEGPASAAYESSLRVENGTEKSMYEQSQDNGAKHQQDTTPYEKEYTDDGHEKYNNDFSNDQINEEQSNLDNLLEKGTISQEQYDEWSNQIRN